MRARIIAVSGMLAMVSGEVISPSIAASDEAKCAALAALAQPMAENFGSLYDTMAAMPFVLQVGGFKGEDLAAMKDVEAARADALPHFKSFLETIQKIGVEPAVWRRSIAKRTENA